MLVTPYSSDNQAFSDKAHAAAQRLVYPRIFAGPIEYEVPKEIRFLDTHYGIDRILRLTPHADAGCRFTIPVTVQERFRLPKFASYEDITITEWNNVTDQPSELYKMCADLFVYGYYSPDLDTFVRYVKVYRTIDLKLGIKKGNIQGTRQTNPRSDQPFLTLSFDAARSAELISLPFQP